MTSGRPLLVAMAGGHLSQLVELAPRLPFPVDNAIWVTVETAQSRALTRDRDVRFVAFVQPRDVLGVLGHARAAQRLYRTERIDVAVSTGSSIALAFLPLAAVRRIPAHYIESAARRDGPSLTGRLLARVPGVQGYTQSTSWASSRWPHAGSVLDGFERVEQSPKPVRRLVVTIGTGGVGFGFRALLERLVAIVPRDREVVWQTGTTDLSGLGIDGRPGIDAAELADLLAAADAVVAHAGTGSALAALNAGRLPVLVPRRAARGETVDDHQLEIARDLEQRGLALAVEADRLEWADIEESARWHVRRASAMAPLALRT